MKPGRLLVAAVLFPALFCPAQDKMPAAKDAAKPVLPDSYIIGASDNISVTVFKEPTLSSSLLVRPDGMISMPLLGDVRAAGRTTQQLADEIAVMLKKYIQDPNVTVVLAQVNSKKKMCIRDRPWPCQSVPKLHSNQPVFALLAGCLQDHWRFDEALARPAADRLASESSEQELPAHSDSLDR